MDCPSGIAHVAGGPVTSPGDPWPKGLHSQSSTVPGNFCDDGNGCICWPVWGPPTTRKHLKCDSVTEELNLWFCLN